jgi:hypothetical protein
MKEYKIETLVYYTQISLDEEHIAKESTKDIHSKLDE